MKYISTYENILTNLFKKKETLPKEVIDFGESLMKFIEKNINNKEWDVFTNMPHKNKYNKISIFIDPYDMDDAAEIVELFYNVENSRILYCFIPKLNFLDDIKNYLKYIIKQIKIGDLHTAGSYAKNEDRFFIPVDKIDYIIKKLNDEEFELFKTSRKFNI